MQEYTYEDRMRNFLSSLGIEKKEQILEEKEIPLRRLEKELNAFARGTKKSLLDIGLSNFNLIRISHGRLIVSSDYFETDYLFEKAYLKRTKDNSIEINLFDSSYHSCPEISLILKNLPEKPFVFGKINSDGSDPRDGGCYQIRLKKPNIYFEFPICRNVHFGELGEWYIGPWITGYRISPNEEFFKEEIAQTLDQFNRLLGLEKPLSSREEIEKLIQNKMEMYFEKNRGRFVSEEEIVSAVFPGAVSLEEKTMTGGLAKGLIEWKLIPPKGFHFDFRYSEFGVWKEVALV